MMKTFRRLAILTAVVLLMLMVDMVPEPVWLPLDIQVISDANAVAGRARRTRRRGAAVGYQAGKASASSECPPPQQQQ